MLFYVTVPEYELVHIHHHPRKRDVDISENLIDSNDDKTNLKLKAFGKHLNLTLTPNRGLFAKNRLKIWTVEPNATAQHGVEYVQLPEVSSSNSS